MSNVKKKSVIAALNFDLSMLHIFFMHFIFTSGPHYNQSQTIMFELMNAVANQRCSDESLLKRLFCTMCAHAD